MSETIETTETIDPQAATPGAPPHPRAVARVLKQATRDWLAESGAAIGIVLNAIPTFVHTASQAFSGTVTRGASYVPFPATVTFKVGAELTMASIAVNQTTGAFNGTIAANALTAGAKSATVTATSPVGTSPAVAFTVT